MRIVIGNKIYIENCQPEFKTKIKKALTLPNPQWYTLQRMGNSKALYGVPKSFIYYEEKDGWLIIGRGLETRIKDYCMATGLPYKPEYKQTDNPLSEPLNGEVTLRDYQEEPYLEAFYKFHVGILQLGTGFGKTVISCKLIKDHGQSAIILTHRGHILSQFKDEFKKWYNYDVGVIQGNNIDVKDITVAMVQSLTSKPELLDQIKERFGLLVVDECHTFITEKRLKVIQSFNPKYLYGLSATPFRTDQQDRAIHFTFGDVLASGDLPRTPPKINIINSETPIEYGEYHDMVEAMVTNDKRNDMIARLVDEQVKEDRKVLVLTKRIDHYERISEKLKSKDIHTINSSDKQEDRNEMLAKMREGKMNFKVLLGTFPMLSTGTDIPQLDTLVFAGDLKSSVLTQQSAGRILRLFDGKKEPLIIDVIDSKNKVFTRQAKHRLNFYKEQEWEILKK